MEITTLKQEELNRIRTDGVLRLESGWETVPESVLLLYQEPEKKLSKTCLRNKNLEMIRQAGKLWETPPKRKKKKKKKKIKASGKKALVIQPEKKEPAITVNDLVIRYRNLQNVSIKKQLLNRHKKDKSSGYFEALHGISFEVAKGEILGIIGKNGSGKSTLLKTLGGIFSPDKGSVDLHGHNVSLLSIGVGFQKELSGRENIILSGLLLGYREREIRAKVDEIIEFSELGDFIDKPVRTYSSGMYSKLAFSITAVLKTDIMLIDEVLSVGDQHFKRKSYAKMRSLIGNKDRTVVIVSHSIRYLRELCTKVLWLHEGNLVKIGPADKILDEYQAFMER